MSFVCSAVERGEEGLLSSFRAAVNGQTRRKANGIPELGDFKWCSFSNKEVSCGEMTRLSMTKLSNRPGNWPDRADVHSQAVAGLNGIKKPTPKSR